MTKTLVAQNIEMVVAFDPLILIPGLIDVQAIIVFVISIHAYAYEKSEMEEISLVALSGCIWLQAFVMILETK